MRHTRSYKTLNNSSESEFSHVPSVITCTLPEGPSFLKVGYFKGKDFPCYLTGSYSQVSENEFVCVCVYFKQ